MTDLYPSSHSTMGEISKILKGKIFQTDFGGQFSQLPEEIVLGIFSRLPLKDLKRCRCVKKSWYQSIPSPCFSTLHHEKSISRGTYFVSYILQEFNVTDSSVPYDLYLLEFSYSTESFQYLFDITPLKTKFEDMNLNYQIVGSCNGVLCLCETSLYDPVYICNPLIGEYITLPKWNGLTDESIVPGFGFDKETGDYKVIRMAYHKEILSDGEIRRDLVTEVYTLGSKNWRNIGIVPFAPRGDKPGVFLNGVIHWIGDTCKIVCFDIAKEKFSLLGLPPGYNNDEIDSDYAYRLEIRVIKGNLCFFDENIRRRLAIWMMKKYGDEQSWRQEDIFDGLFTELCVVYGILLRFQHTRDLCPHMVSFVSHIDPEEEEASSGEDDCSKLGKWSKRLYPIGSGPQPHGGTISELEEDGDLEEEGTEGSPILCSTDFDILTRLLSL